MKDKVRVGIVGSKFAADLHAESYSRNEHVQMVAVAAIDNLEAYSARWKIPKTYLDYREMLKREDLDLVSVCVPNFLHHDVAIAVANSGRDMVCEKPLATTVADAEEVVDVVRKKGVKLIYAEDWIFSPSLRRVCQIIQEGAVGRVLYIKAKEVHNGTHSPFAKDKTKCGGGSLIHLGIHPVGWILHVLGQEGRNPVVQVTGNCTGGSQDNLVHKDNTGEDFGVGIMTFANGERGFVEGNYITVGGMDDTIEVYGSEGVIKVDLTFGSPVSVYSRPGYKYCIEKADNTLGWTKPAVDEFYNLGYVDELAYAVDCVRAGRQPMHGCSAQMGLACVKIIKAMYESSETGRAVRGTWG